MVESACRSGGGGGGGDDDDDDGVVVVMDRNCDILPSET